MKISVTSIVLIIAFSSQALAQGDLHVKGKIRSDSLANQNYLIIYADSTGTLDTLPAGLPGQVLISNGQGGKPYWGMSGGGGSVLYANSTAVGTNADTLEKVLASYTLPANTLDSNNIGIEITFFGTHAPNSNNRTIRLKFGGDTVIEFTITLANFHFYGVASILRTGTTTFKSIANIQYATETGAISAQPNILTTGNADFTTDNIIEFTGQNSVALANHVRLDVIIIKLIK